MTMMSQYQQTTLMCKHQKQLHDRSYKSCLSVGTQFGKFSRHLLIYRFLKWFLKNNFGFIYRESIHITIWMSLLFLYLVLKRKHAMQSCRGGGKKWSKLAWSPPSVDTYVHAGPQICTDNFSVSWSTDVYLNQAAACLWSRATNGTTATVESRTFQHNHMSETGIYVICQYGIKIDLTDKKVGLWEANEANMKRADEPA